jgi:hypothetical protein
MKNRESIKISGEIFAETEKAILFFDGGDADWIPRSQIIEIEESNHFPEVVTITIPEWLAIEKGFI